MPVSMLPSHIAQNLSDNIDQIERSGEKVRGLDTYARVVNPRLTELWEVLKVSGYLDKLEAAWYALNNLVKYYDGAIEILNTLLVEADMPGLQHLKSEFTVSLNKYRDSRKTAQDTLGILASFLVSEDDI